MKDLDIKTLLKRAEELRALFILGQRVIPFLEDLFNFVGEVQPLLEEINKSIKENISKMPNLTKQLSKVTEATELATNEILDIIDGIFYKLDILQSNIKEVEKNCEVVNSFVTNFSNLFAKVETNSLKKEEFFEEAYKVFETFKKDYVHITFFETFKNMVGSIREDSTSIMLALQVQDITSQQIAAVNHLLNTVQDKLNSLLNKFNATDVEQVVSQATETINVTKLHREVAFDPDAVETLVGNSTKQEDIDKIFSQGLGVETPLDASFSTGKPEVKEEEMGNDSAGPEQFSQSEIDALFNQNKPNL